MLSTPCPDDVAAVFKSCPDPVRKRLLTLRELILKTAEETDGVGRVEETLRWGEPSYLTSETGSGTTIRINRVNGSDEKYGLFVHCQTTLVETYHAMYPDVFEYSGSRGILFHVDDDIHEEAICHCIALALCYHLDRKKHTSPLP